MDSHSSDDIRILIDRIGEYLKQDIDDRERRRVKRWRQDLRKMVAT